ncbi:hypothetical protein [Streptomyces sp. DH24]|uniref:hypothetical protein n=1 Tax=Streptomyces sp. DH24 TaxID=3040123 RepID=UPI002441B7F1|nr:hypothetical protein [Streptomyces sp. DH24]MDG9716866.1 hypothetical protein [Streptomyces sp. DH24]
MTPGRQAAVAVILAVTVTACGTERGGQPEAASPRPSFTPRPKCAQAAEVPAVPSASPSSAPAPSGDAASQEPPADAPPNYAENHAYRMKGSLTAQQRAQGQASARLIERELERAREKDGLGDARIEAALRALGCGPDHGVYVERGFYSVHTGVTCVSGRATREEITSEVHGAYVEPQPGTGPCVENRGGH